MTQSLFEGEKPTAEGRTERYWQRVAKPLDLEPLTSKAIYVAGLIRHLAESAGLCLNHDRHLAAYLLTVEAIEVLGAAAVLGSSQGHEAANRGLQFLINSLDGEEDEVVVRTRFGAYQSETA